MIDPKALSRQRYAEHALAYVNSRSHASGSDLERLLALAQAQPHWRMLDIATGGGHTARTFAPFLKEVIASDITPEMLAQAEAHIRAQGIGNVRFQLADAEDLPFADEQFDLVTCRIAPHHFPNVGRFLQEAARVLRRGGMFLLQDHLLPDDPQLATFIEAFERLRDPSHKRAFSQQEWAQMVEGAGLRIIHMETMTKHHPFLEWVSRQGNTPETIAELIALVAEAPAAVQDWMQIEAWAAQEASFVNHHLILAAARS